MTVHPNQGFISKLQKRIHETSANPPPLNPLLVTKSSDKEKGVNIAEVYVLSATYNGQTRTACLKLYEPLTQKIVF
jgi:hypothetical protein